MTDNTNVVATKGLAERSGLTMPQVNALLVAIREALLEGKRVRLQCVGTLRTTTLKARSFELPKLPGKIYKKGKRRNLVFTASRVFKKDLNNGNS